MPLSVCLSVCPSLGISLFGFHVYIYKSGCLFRFFLVPIYILNVLIVQPETVTSHCSISTVMTCAAPTSFRLAWQKSEHYQNTKSTQHGTIKIKLINQHKFVMVKVTASPTADRGGGPHPSLSALCLPQCQPVDFKPHLCEVGYMHKTVQIVRRS